MESGSIEIANRFIDTVTDRFFTLARFPYIGRSREEDFGPGHRSLAVGECVIVYCVEDEGALILRVVHRAPPARPAFRTLTHWRALPSANRHFLRTVLKCYH